MLKALVALAAAAVVTAAVGFWFMSNPVVATAQVKPLQPSADMPVFKRVPTNLQQGAPH